MSLRKDQPELLYESDIERTCRKLKKEAREIKEKLKMADEARQCDLEEAVAAAKARWDARLQAEISAKEAEELNRTWLESITPQS